MRLRRHVVLSLASIALMSPSTVQAVATRLDLTTGAGIRWSVRAAADLPTNYPHEPAPAGQGGWTPAIVPGTVFSSFVAAGVEADPNFGDNIHRVDRAKYDRDFWYRTEFAVPAGFSRGRVWLNFAGVNRDADVFLNTRFLGSVRGIVQRGRFDVTALLRPDGANTLAVLVRVPQMPISNGASPTYGSSAGWDWMPRVPGLNSGIQDEVFLTTTGDVSIIDPWITSDLPDLARAGLTLRTELHNASSAERTGVLRGVIEPGGIEFSVPVSIPPLETKRVQVDPEGFPQLWLAQPRLWWPNGYGDAPLYTCRLSFTADHGESDAREVTFGIRRLEIDFSKGPMRIVVNGTPIFARGGNWGMPEYLLRVTPEDYERRVRLHRDMNFNIIRNWMGSTTHEAFYEACDRHGILVWDDFWLNSSGGLPRDIHVFNANAVEKLKRLRNHPSIALWCGDNEGDPPAPLDDWLAADVKAFDGRHYHPNSHSRGLSGSGPWRPLEPQEYFLRAAPGNWGGDDGWGMRSEMGSAVFVNLESLRKFIRADALWPRNEMWDRHYFGPAAMYAGPDDYEKALATRYGPAAGIEEFCRKAQLLNLETTRAMFEGWADNLWNDATGLIIWMSQSAYPSLVWQTYDYYYDATGAYWGAKHACEPVHIQWNCGTGGVKVINTTREPLAGVRAEARIYGLDGVELPALATARSLDVPAGSAAAAFSLAAGGGDLARGCATRVSSVHVPSREGDKMVDDDPATRWESDYADHPWCIVDLGTVRRIRQVVLDWDPAHARTYKLQASVDAITWQDIHYGQQCAGGVESIDFPATDARYVRLYCIEKATTYAISLRAFKVFGDADAQPRDVHFLRLRLTDRDGRLLSENLYWRGARFLDYRGLNALPPVRLAVKTETAVRDGRPVLVARVANPADAPAAAFAIHVQVRDRRTGERILPFFATANYFTLMRGESREIVVSLDDAESLLPHAELSATPFNAAR
jgi:hypothetical protein